MNPQVSYVTIVVAQSFAFRRGIANGVGFCFRVAEVHSSFLQKTGENVQLRNVRNQNKATQAAGRGDLGGTEFILDGD